MNTIKVFFASLAWLVFLFIFKEYDPNFSSSIIFYEYFNWFLGIFSILSIVMIIFGLIGFIWNKHKNNKEKERKFGEMLVCGIIILITASLSYAMVIVPSAPPVY
jgi:glucose uptake protein GlcU